MTLLENPKPRCFGLPYYKYIVRGAIKKFRGCSCCERRAAGASGNFCEFVCRSVNKYQDLFNKCFCDDECTNLEVHQQTYSNEAMSRVRCEMGRGVV